MKTPTYLINEIYPETEDDQDDFLTWEDKDPFHIGQSYEKKPARQIKCKKCGSTEFHVAQGDWYSAIRCKNCRWEMGIHNG